MFHWGYFSSRGLKVFFFSCEMDEKSPGPIHVDIQTVEKHIVIYS